MTVSVMEKNICLILYFAHKHCQMKRERTLQENLSLTKEKERYTINTTTTTCNWSQQRKSNGTVSWIEQRKMSFLKLVLKNVKKLMCQKRNKCLKIKEKNIK